MKWTKAFRGGKPGSWTHDALQFYDLIDDDGSQAAWVREDTRVPPTFTAFLAMRPYEVAHKFSTLRAAKAWVIATLVAERLDRT